MAAARWLPVLIGLALAAGAAAVYFELVKIPERFNPWAALDVAAPPNLLTGYKLSRAKADPARCRAALSQTGLRYEPLPDRVTAPGCGFENAVRLSAGASLRIGAPVPLSCRAALSFAMWERHALQPAAVQHLGQPVAQIAHLGSYACRNINTGEGPSAMGRRSRHATADALDVAAFTLADGRRISLLRNWRPAAGKGSAGPNPAADPAALFLRAAQRGGCSYFDSVLGPDYNAVHADHLHLETGGFGLCR